VQAIKLWPGASITIEGHTDSVGSDASNQVLSQNRGKSVRDYFASAGLADYAMTVVGYGAGRPVATNDTEQGRAANRRVEIVVVPATKQDASTSRCSSTAKRW